MSFANAFPHLISLKRFEGMMKIARRADAGDARAKAALKRLTVYVSQKNLKLGSNIASISLRPGKPSRGGDCAPWVPCSGNGCYAEQMQSYRPTLKATWTNNSNLARNNRDEYFAQVRAWCALPVRTDWFRWHVAGDILDQAYLEEMKAIARAWPATRFLCFTKRHDFKYKNLPPNLAIIFSVWPGWGNIERLRRLGLPIAWVEDKAGKETRIPKDAIACPGSCAQCSMCWHLKKVGKDVKFHEHGPTVLAFKS